MTSVKELQLKIDKALVDEIELLRTQLAEEKEMNLRWKKAVEGLTPTGSEFVNDPERCAAFIRDRTRWPKQIIEARKKLAEAQERAGRMEGALKSIRSKASGFTMVPLVEIANIANRSLIDTDMKKGKDRRDIVCLCGSTKFKEEYEIANREFTLMGHIVLSVGFFGHQMPGDLDRETKNALDELHKRKIDMADYIFVINPGNYIGDSTLSEIQHANKTGKPVHYLIDTVS